VANRSRGELDIDLDGQTYTLVLDIEAMCQIEDAASKTMAELVEGVLRGGIRPLRLIIWGALRRHHGALSIADVGDLMSRIGLPALMAKFNELAKSMAPEEADAKALKLRPRKAQAVA
jgi:hypothetical protein